MIQRAHFVEDKEAIIRLWQQCFGDERHYVEFFLENCPKENALFLYRKKDVVVGMMFLMPGMLKVPADIGESEECAVQMKNTEAGALQMNCLILPKTTREKIMRSYVLFRGHQIFVNTMLREVLWMCLSALSRK